MSLLNTITHSHIRNAIPVPILPPMPDVPMYAPPVQVTAHVNNVQAEERFQLEVEYEDGYEWYRVNMDVAGMWIPTHLDWLPFEQAWEEYSILVEEYMGGNAS